LFFAFVNVVSETEAGSAGLRLPFLGICGEEYPLPLTCCCVHYSSLLLRQLATFLRNDVSFNPRDTGEAQAGVKGAVYIVVIGFGMSNRCTERSASTC